MTRDYLGYQKLLKVKNLNYLYVIGTIYSTRIDSQ